ncbi:MAG: SDR family NAD(P)-dependent oxidoreductase [bacterium]|nr:SDR family NAD(P)-dependent oxidoreductase [bacterium]
MAARFGGRTVLITGATSGIGRAATLAFLAEGARVVAVARGRERLDAMAAEAGCERLIVEAADVSDGDSMERLAQRVLDTVGAPDVIVANAGIGLDARFDETTDEALRSVLEVNVLGVVRSVRPYLPAMLERGSGRVLLISSIVGKRGVPHYTAYSASKFALHGLADALRAEIYGSGVSVGIVCPSSTATEFQQRLKRIGPEQKKKRPRLHSVESVARAILKMATSRRREIVLSAEAKLMVFVDWLAPGLVDRLLWHYLVGRRKKR